MSTEINTRGMVRSKVASFPAGNDAECLSKTEILSQSGQDAYIGGSYGNTECARIDDVKQISGIYSGSYSITPEGAETSTSATEAHVSISNGVATIHFIDIWYGWMFLGNINLKISIQNGILINLLSVETELIPFLVSFKSGFLNGFTFDIELKISAVANIDNILMRYTGTKQ